MFKFVKGAFESSDGYLSMCLIKVYLDRGESKELIARDVAFVLKKEDKIVLRNLELEDLTSIERGLI